MREKQYLSSVKNAFRILRCFSVDEPERKVGDIATELELNKSTVSRTLATMASEGFVYKSPKTNQYRLGLSIVSLSGVVNSQMDIYHEAQPVLNHLVVSTDETAHISIMDQLDIIYLQKVDCHHPVQVLTHVGKRNPAYCTSAGKAILAYSSFDIVNQVINEGLKPYTKTTITDPDEFITHLKQIREDGYTLSQGELQEGVISIAAPIFDYTNNVIAALSIVGPQQRLQSHKIKSLAYEVMAAADEISERMGYIKMIRR